MAEIDALVVPSVWYENTPLVIYSAQAEKCPVIGSDLPGIAEVIIHQYNGLLFEAGSSAGLSTQISKLIDDDRSVVTLSNNAIKIKTIQDYVEKLLLYWGMEKDL